LTSVNNRPNRPSSGRMLSLLKTHDRHIIYFMVLVLLTVPFFFKIPLHVEPTKTVRTLYDKIEKLGGEQKDGWTYRNGNRQMVLVVPDWDAATMAECRPQTAAIVRHLMEKKLKFAIVTHILTGIPFTEEICKSAAEDYKKRYGTEVVYGRDYVNLGYVAGGELMVRKLAANIRTTAPKDLYQTPIDDIPALEGINSVDNISLLCQFTGSGLYRSWVQLFQSTDAKTNYRPPMGHGCTGVIIPEVRPYLDSGQMIGILGGMTGAAEYETLLGYEGRATDAMLSQTFAHVAIIIVVFICNLFYLASKISNKRKVAG
jgi:hypothetical protein